MVVQASGSEATNHTCLSLALDWLCSAKKAPSAASGGSTPLNDKGLGRMQAKGQAKGGGGGSLKLLWLTRRFSPHFHHELLQQVGHR